MCARSAGSVWQHRVVSADDIEVSALAINVVVPEALRWTDTRRGDTCVLTTLNVRLLGDGHLAAKAYGRPVAGGRGAYVSFRVPDRPELAALVARAADRAGSLWAAHRGLHTDSALRGLRRGGHPDCRSPPVASPA